jgi:protein-disulfide isomerase
MRLLLLKSGLCLSGSLLAFSVWTMLKSPGIHPGTELLPLLPDISSTDAMGDSKPVLGSENAKEKYVVFTDFECPACAPEWDLLTQFASASPNVAIYVRELPLEGMHPKARKAAIAAEIARKRGKFAQVASRLYRSDLSEKSIAKCLALEGISKRDQTTLTPAAEQAVAHDVETAQRWGIHATPTVMLARADGKVYRVVQFAQILRVVP